MKMKSVSASVLIGLGLFGVTAEASTWDSFVCTPTQVAMDDLGTSAERVTVQCSTPGPNGSGSNTIYFFAVGSANAEQANRFLSISTAAFLSGKHLAFFYNHTSNTGGCATSNCRTPAHITLQ